MKWEDLENVITIVTIVYTVLWEFPQPPLPALNERIAALIPYGYRNRPDALSILKTFSLLLAPVPRDIYNTRYDDMRSIITNVWSKLGSIPPPRPGLLANSFTLVTGHSFRLLPTDQSFIDLIYLGIQGGSQYPFIAVYAASTYESFSHQDMWRNCHPQENSSQCIQVPSSRICRDG